MRAAISLLLLANCTLEAQVGAPSSDPQAPARNQVPEGLMACDTLVDFGPVPVGRTLSSRARCRFEAGATVVDAVDWVEAVDGLNLQVLANGAPAVLPRSFEASDELELIVELRAVRPGDVQAKLRIHRSQALSTDVLVRGLADANLNCALRADPPVLDFGSRGVNTVQRSRVEITNVGTGTCAVEAVAMLEGSSPTFALVGPARATLAPDARTSVELRFLPDALGGHHGVLGLYGSRQYLLRGLPLQGFGRAQGELPTVLPAILDFGRRAQSCVNLTEQRFRITAGDAPLDLRLQLVTEDDDHPSAFQLAVETASIGAGASLDVPVYFLPSDAAGPLHARVRVSGQGFDPVYVDLFGETGNDSTTEQRFEGEGPFALAGPPVHNTMEVWLDDRILPQTYAGRVVWALDYITHELVVRAPLDPDSAIFVRFEQACTQPTCGNGVVDPGEHCDDGNQILTDDCLPGCQPAHCGDGVVRAGSLEECDDGNSLSGDGCNAICLLERCGNGVIEGDEECDTGSNRSDTEPNACRMDCREPDCGDGVVDTFETCDDGNSSTSDACISCRSAVCGDGYVFAGVEECDDANRVDGDACSSDCTLPVFQHEIVGVEGYPGPPPVSPTNLGRRLTLPFPFTFLGRPVTVVDASQPGLVIFGPSSPIPDNAVLPEAGGPNGFLAWWWDDLVVAGATYAWTYGFPGNRVLSLRYDGVIRRGAPDTRYFAEIHLQERSGVISVHYGPHFGESHVGSASVGWESIEGDRGADVLGCAPNCSNGSWPSFELHLYVP